MASFRFADRVADRVLRPSLEARVTDGAIVTMCSQQPESQGEMLASLIVRRRKEVEWFVSNIDVWIWYFSNHRNEFTMHASPQTSSFYRARDELMSFSQSTCPLVQEPRCVCDACYSAFVADTVGGSPLRTEFGILVFHVSLPTLSGISSRYAHAIMALPQADTLYILATSQVRTILHMEFAKKPSSGRNIMYLDVETILDGPLTGARFPAVMWVLQRELLGGDIQVMSRLALLLQCSDRVGVMSCGSSARFFANRFPPIGVGTIREVIDVGVACGYTTFTGPVHSPVISSFGQARGGSLSAAVRGLDGDDCDIAVGSPWEQFFQSHVELNVPELG